MRAIPSLAVDFIAEHEGLRLTAYQDRVGVWTIGYGHTGPEVHAGLRVTRAQARAFLADDVSTAGTRLGGMVKPAVMNALTDHQHAALLSFVFNVGCDGRWTIWRRLNARAFDQVPLELAKFVNGTVGGRKVKIRGLVNRRAAEIALWSTDEPGSVPHAPPSSETRAMTTPPTPADPTPPARSATVLSLTAGAIASVPVAADQVSKAVQPYAQNSPAVQQGVALLALISAAAVVIGLALAWIAKRRARA